MDDREFYDTTYDRLDVNDDDYLDATEWDRGYNDLYGSYLGTNDVGQFDTDADGMLDNDEFYEGFRDTDYFNDYDANRDGIVDSDEMNEAVYTNWDANQDNYIDQDEFDRYGDYYMNDF